jgi:tetratricopeptide (TPR) repeat protein
MNRQGLLRGHSKALGQRWIGLLAVVAIGLSAGCSREARRDRHLKRGDTFYQAGQLAKAAIEYQNALRLDPLHPVCLRQLGKVYDDQGQYNRALGLLEKAAEATPQDLDVQMRLCRIYLSANRPAKAHAAAAAILTRQPTNEEALRILAETAVTPEEVAEVDRRVEAFRAQVGERGVCHLITGLRRLRQKDLAGAEQAFQQAAKLDPASPAPHWALGNLYLAQGQRQAAHQQFEQAVRLAPRNWLDRVRFAEYKIRLGAVEEARSLLQALVKEAPEFLPAWSALAAVALEQHRYEDCAALVAKVLAQRPEDYLALLTRARLSLAQTNLAQAIAQLTQMRAAYDRVPQVSLELARAYLLSNDLANATTALDRALSLNPNYPEALWLKGQLALRKRDFGTAPNVLMQLARLNPNRPDVQFALAAAHRGHGAYDAALAIYQNLAKGYPTNPQPHFLSGLIYRQQNKLAEAEAAFTQALQRQPGHLSALDQLVKVKLAQKQVQAARKLVDDLLARSPRLAVGWFMLAMVHRAAGDTNNAEAALLKAIELDTNAVAAYSVLAQLYAESGRGAEAVRKLDQALAQAPNNPVALIQKAMLLDRLGQYSQAAETYEKLLTVAPRLVLALNNLAYLYSEHLGKLDRARTLATQACELAPDSPQAADTLGWILYRQGDYARAFALVSKAAADLPDEPEIQFHLGMIHCMQGQETEARSALRHALELSQDFPGAQEARQRLAALDAGSDPADPQAVARLEKLVTQQPRDLISHMRLAQLYSRQGAWDKARAAYEQVLNINPRSVPALIQLAELYAGPLRNPTKALALAKEARSLAPEDPHVDRAFGRIAYEAGEHSWAVNLLQESVRKQPDQPDLRYHLGWALYSVGRVTEAQEQMRTALQLAPNFAQAESARRFLAWTDQAAQTQPSTQAVAAAEAALQADPNFVPALMLLGAAHTAQGRWDQARQTYQKVLAKFPQFTPAIRALVLLPRGSGDVRQDYDLATKARRAFPNDPEVAKALGKIQYQRGEFSAALPLFQEALRSLTNDAALHFYQGMTQLKLGRKDQARRSLQRASELGLPPDLASEATRTLLELR